MLTATKIRLYPTAAQEEKLAQAFGCARWFWNNSLAETQKVYQETGKGLRQYALNARLPSLKKEHEWLADTHSQVLQSVSLNLSRAFGNFFDRRAKYPNFKSKSGRQSIQYPQGVKIVDERKIFLPKLGHIKAVVHRPVVGRIKTVTVSRTPAGHYFASLLTENDIALPAVSFDGKFLGIDVGLTSLVVTSDGKTFDNPRHLARASKNLKRKQQKLSRKTKGSNTRSKAKRLVAKAHNRVANARKDGLHKLSNRLVNENQVLAVEDLHVKGMMKNRHLSKSISDASWGMLVGFLEYKAARAGKGFIKVNRFFPSSKLCSNCGHKQKEMHLNVRSWLCTSCNTMHDRDINAANNIRLEAQRLRAAGIAGPANRGTVSQVQGQKPLVLARAVDVGSQAL